MRLIDADPFGVVSFQGKSEDFIEGALFILDKIDEAPTIERPQWVLCSERLPTAEDGERVLVHLSFDKPACEYVYIPWKTVGFEYQVGHIDAWFAIPPFEQSTIDMGS